MHYHEERTLAQFEDSSTLRRSIILAAALSPAFAALFVGLRFYTARAILRGGIHKDDCEFFFLPLSLPLDQTHLASMCLV